MQSARGERRNVRCPSRSTARCKPVTQAQRRVAEAEIEYMMSLCHITLRHRIPSLTLFRLGFASRVQRIGIVIEGVHTMTRGQNFRLAVQIVSETRAM